jgi:membrane glycosyltransferase
LLVSIVVETLLSAWMAPLLLVHHAQSVLSIGLGRAFGWSAQHRGASASTSALIRLELPTTLLGLGLLLGLHTWLPALLWWLAPLWLPALSAIPLSLSVSSATLGRWSRRLGLFLTGSERDPHPLLERARELRTMTVGHAAARFRDLVLDPVLLAAHLKRLPATPVDDARLAAAYARALRLGPAALSTEECTLLASDADTLRRLHREAWQRWPVESWGLTRLHPHTPPRSDRGTPHPDRENASDVQR